LEFTELKEYIVTALLSKLITKENKKQLYLIHIGVALGEGCNPSPEDASPHRKIPGANSEYKIHLFYMSNNKVSRIASMQLNETNDYDLKFGWENVVALFPGDSDSLPRIHNSKVS